MAGVAQLMTDRERDERSGRFTEEYPNHSFIRAIEAEDGTAGTTDIAERVGCNRRTAYNKLNQMADDGILNRQKIGNSLVWSVENNTDS